MHCRQLQESRYRRFNRLPPNNFLFFQAEDGIRDGRVTGVQTCALPILSPTFRRIRGSSTAGSQRPTQPGSGKRMKARRTLAMFGPLLALCAAAMAAGPEVISRDVRSPEGPIFVGDTLYLADYVGHNVVRLQDQSAKVIWHRDGCGPTGLARVPEGLLVACFDGKSVV